MRGANVQLNLSKGACVGIFQKADGNYTCVGARTAVVNSWSTYYFGTGFYEEIYFIGAYGAF